MVSLLSRIASAFAAEPEDHVYWLTHDLALCAEPAREDWPTLYEAGFRCVLDLRAEAESNAELVESHGLKYLRVPVIDEEPPGDSAMRLITSWIIEQIGSTGPVLVHCRQGRGRSAMVVCAVLVKLGLPLQDAYRTLRHARHDVLFSDAQTAALARFATQTATA